MIRLPDLHAAHQGKGSDKWSSYLEYYDELFHQRRDRPVRILEIGVQNGGALEIWAKYFPAATRIVGCDIEEACRNLTFEDHRIAVVIGDATTSEICSRIQTICDSFDIIIDDGSHRSSDIIRSFARYFPLLAEGGLYIAEDLHCSYWQEFGGGIEHPASALSFFRRLTDYVNREHWGSAIPSEDILSYFAQSYDIDLAPSDLARIMEVRFRNSIAVTLKSAPDKAGLGKRIITGAHYPVSEGIRIFDQMTLSGPQQDTNPFGPKSLRREQAMARGAVGSKTPKGDHS